MDIKQIQKDIFKAVETVRRGGIILYPTDTIWGLGCDATNTDAVERLFEIKHRPGSKAMISLVDSLETLEKWVWEIPEKAEEAINNQSGSLTIIYDSPRGITPSLMAEDGSAAFRITTLNFTRQLCATFGKPLVSTSANISGQIAPRTFSEIPEEIIRSVDYTCSFGRDLHPAEPSRILKIGNDGSITVIR